MDENKMACKGADTMPCEMGIESAQECLYCGTKVRDDLVEHPFFGFKAHDCDSVD